MSKKLKDGKSWQKNASIPLAAAFGVEEIPEQDVKELRTELFAQQVSEVAIQAALEKAFVAKAWQSLFAKADDAAFAEQFGIKLRTDKGRQLALSADDVKGIDPRVSLTLPDRDGNPVVRTLGGLVYHNQLVGMTRAAERTISDGLFNSKPGAREAAQLIRLELRDASDAVRKSVLADFYRPYQYKLEKGVVSAFLKGKRPQRTTRKDQLKASLSAEMRERFEAAMAKVRAELAK